jgi:hypothetical protein
VPTARTVLSATLNGVALTGLRSAFCTYSWKQNNGLPTATLYVKDAITSQLYDQTLNLTMGAGNNVLRFVGLLRGYSDTLWTPSEGLTFQGRLIRAAEYQNHDDSASSANRVGGLLLNDILGAPTGTDQAIVRAVLTRASATRLATSGVRARPSARGRSRRTSSGAPAPAPSFRQWPRPGKPR